MLVSKLPDIGNNGGSLWTSTYGVISYHLQATFRYYCSTMPFSACTEAAQDAINVKRRYRGMFFYHFSTFLVDKFIIIDIRFFFTIAKLFWYKMFYLLDFLACSFKYFWKKEKKTHRHLKYNFPKLTTPSKNWFVNFWRWWGGGGFFGSFI